MALKVMYTIFLGLLVSLFVGLGIAAFYQSPKMPEYPIELEKPLAPNQQETAEQETLRVKYREDQKAFQELSGTYNRNVSIVVVIAAIIVLVVSLTLVNRIQFISDGLLLGGVLTLLYAIIRGFMGENNVYRFLVVTIGLVVALVVGYIKFIKPQK